MEIAKPACTDPVILNQWHVISALDEFGVGVVNETLLLDERVSFTTTPDGEFLVWRSSASLPVGAPVDAAKLDRIETLPVKPEYGYLWTSLGDPPADLFPLPEYHHPRRRNMNAGSVGVATSAPRAVENFLDLAHFPYVHEGSLGVLPHTEVVEYDVKVIDGEIHATKCDFMVPKVGVNFDAPVVMRYRYRVPHPYCVMLYYDSLPDPSIEDICAIWVQPMTAELVRAHNYMGVIDDTSSDTEIKAYQLLIFSPGQAHPGEPAPQAAPARPPRRDADPSRSLCHHIPALAGRSGCHLRRDPRPQPDLIWTVDTAVWRRV